MQPREGRFDPLYSFASICKFGKGTIHRHCLHSCGRSSGRCSSSARWTIRTSSAASRAPSMPPVAIALCCPKYPWHMGKKLIDVRSFARSRPWRTRISSTWRLLAAELLFFCTSKYLHGVLVLSHKCFSFCVVLQERSWYAVWPPIIGPCRDDDLLQLLEATSRLHQNRSLQVNFYVSVVQLFKSISTSFHMFVTFRIVASMRDI